MTETPLTDTKAKRRWIRRILIGLLILIAVVVLGGPPLVGMVLGRTLKSMVGSQLNAELQLGSVDYHPPFGVTVNDAMLVGQDDEGRSAALFEIKSINLKLAKMPFGAGPLVIKELIVVEPTIRVIQTDKGVIGQTGLVKDTGPSDPNMKLSEMFELRRVAINGGKFVYEDRRDPKKTPVEWKNVNVDLKTKPEDSANYGYEFKATNAPMADLSAKGRMNIDTLFFELDQFGLQISADAQNIPSQLPPALAEVWKRYKVSGKLNLQAKGQIPLKELDRVAYEARIELTDGSAYLADQQTPLDGVNVDIKVDNHPVDTMSGQPASLPTTQPVLQPLDAPIHVNIDRFQAASGDLAVNLKRGKVTFEPTGLVWKVEDLAGRVNFPDTRPAALATGPLGDIGVRGSVPVTATASGRTIPASGASTRPTIDYRVDLSATNGELFFTKNRIPLTGIKANIDLTPDGVKISRLDAKPMNGKLVNARGQLKFDNQLSWDMSGSFREMDIGLLAPALIDDIENQKRLTGRATINGRASGTLTAVDSAGRFKASGELSVIKGNFASLNMFKKVQSGMHAKDDALTIGEAAAVFEIHSRKIFLHEAAVSSTSLGVQGSGEIGFDGNLQLSLIASLFGDWKKNMENTDIPILSDLGAAIVGGAQEVGKVITKNMYEIKVSGAAKDPTVQMVPAPGLTSTLFENMAQQKIDDRQLIEALKKLPPPKPRPEKPKPATRPRKPRPSTISTTP